MSIKYGGVLVIGGVLTGVALAVILPGREAASVQQVVSGYTDSPSRLTDWQQRAIAARAFAVIDGRLGRSLIPPQPVPLLTAYDKMYVSIMHNEDLRCCMSGKALPSEANRLAADTDQAVSRCLEDDRFGGPLTAEEAANAHIVVSLLYGRSPVMGSVDGLSMQIERGVHGLEIEQGGKSTFFIPSVPVTKNYSMEEMLASLCRKADLEDGCQARPDVRLYRYEAVTFRALRDGTVIPLYRYNPPLEIASITPRVISDRLDLARRWYAANTGEDGLLEYEYFPSSDSYSDERNHVRMTASFWTMVALDRFFGGIEPLPAVTRTLEHYRNQTVCDDQGCRLELDGKAALAFTAFMLLAHIDLPETSENTEWQKKLAQGIMSEQREDGSYRTIYGSDTTSNTDYYPGEAMLALMRLHEATMDDRYLESVKRAFSYYRDYWRGNKNTAFVPWHSQADFLLYRATEDPDVAAFVFEMNDWLIDNHQITESPYPDLIGAFTRSKPGPATYVYLEGLNDAYTLALRLGDAGRAQRYKEAIRQATRYMLQAQYTPDNAFYLPNATRAIGGFRESLTRNAQRVDHTQHAAMALMKSHANGVFGE